MYNCDDYFAFAVFNLTDKTIEKRDSIPPSLPINGTFHTKNVEFIECWYQKYALRIISFLLYETPTSDYLSVRFKDYNFRNIFGLYYQINVGPEIYDNRSYYQTVMYDKDDCLELDIPIKKGLPSQNIQIQINAIAYTPKTIVTCIASPTIPSAYDIQLMQVIDKARNLHKSKDIVSKKAGTVQRFSHKLPYKTNYLPVAWKNYPELKVLLDEIHSLCIDLKKQISKLPKSISEMDLSAPIKDIIYIPIECTYDKKFFARLYLLRNNYVTNQIVSSIDFVEYQIPINLYNDALILYLCGTHWLTPVSNPTTEIIGYDLCSDIQNTLKNSCSILKEISRIREILGGWESELLVYKSSIYHLYLECINELNRWINERINEASEFSIGQCPTKWVSEYRLFEYIKIIFPDAIYQYHPNWLAPQSLDIYIPSIRTAIEYQGKQHYEPLAFFGGENKLIETYHRDLKKKTKCSENGIRLLEWPYTKKVFFSEVVSFLNQNKCTHNLSIDFIKNCLTKNLPLPISSLFIDTDTVKKEPELEIRQYEISGIFMKSYSSLQNAAKAVSVSIQQIKKVINGSAQTAGGYRWTINESHSAITNLNPITTKTENTPKAIIQISASGEIIGEYKSINEAERKTNINRKSIRAVLNHIQKSAGGYFWVYKTCKTKDQ